MPLVGSLFVPIACFFFIGNNRFTLIVKLCKPILGFNVPHIGRLLKPFKSFAAIFLYALSLSVTFG